MGKNGHDQEARKQQEGIGSDKHIGFQGALCRRRLLAVRISKGKKVIRWVSSSDATAFSGRGRRKAQPIQIGPQTLPQVREGLDNREVDPAGVEGDVGRRLHIIMTHREGVIRVEDRP